MVEPAQHIVELLRVIGQVDDHVAVDAAFDDAGVGEENVHRHVALERDARDDRFVGAAAVEDEAQAPAVHGGRFSAGLFGRMSALAMSDFGCVNTSLTLPISAMQLWSMTATRWQICSMTRIWCVMTTTVMPSFWLMSLSRSRIGCVVFGSRALVASSHSRTLGSWRGRGRWPRAASGRRKAARDSLSRGRTDPTSSSSSAARA